MKNILFFLLIPVFSFAQKVEQDSMIVRNDSVFYVRTQQLYEYIPDTVGLRDRYTQLQGIIDGLEAEQLAIRERISFFKINGPSSIKAVKQPATKPKKSKQ
jgi:hypothetical protein